MTQVELTNLTAMAAAALAPVLIERGNVSPDRLEQLAENAAMLARYLAAEGRAWYQEGGGSI